MNRIQPAVYGFTNDCEDMDRELRLFVFIVSLLSLLIVAGAGFVAAVLTHGWLWG